MKSKIRTITPAMAQKWLDSANTGNRPIGLGDVRKYARDMAEGRWTLTTQGISFAESGRLLDGQHRLSAIVLSGVPIRMVVWTGCPDDNWTDYDGGKGRKPADFLLDQPHRNVLAGAARKVWMAEEGSGYLATKNSPTRSELLAYVDMNIASLAESVSAVMNVDHNYKRFGSAVFLVYFYHLAKIGGFGDKALAFLRGLATGEQLTKTSPIHVLRERVVDERSRGAAGMKGSHVAMQYLFVRAWRAFRDKRRLTKLAFPRGYSFESTDFDPRV